MNSIRTDRLLLIPLCKEHFPSLYEISKNRKSIEDYQKASPNREYFLGWIQEAMAESAEAWTVHFNDRESGLVTFENIAGPVSEIGFFISREHQNKGIATEAITALLKGLPLRRANIAQVIAQATSTNHASRRVLTKCGFRPIRTIAQNWNWRGVQHDTTEYLWRPEQS